MISHALLAPNDSFKTVLPWGALPARRHLRPYHNTQLLPPIRVYSGADCGSCGKPIDRDGVCKCSS